MDKNNVEWGLRFKTFKVKYETGRVMGWKKEGKEGKEKKEHEMEGQKTAREKFWLTMKGMQKIKLEKRFKNVKSIKAVYLLFF